MEIQEYVANINKRYKLGNATEHTYRGDLQHLIESIVPGVSATNEAKRIECGAPDYVLMRTDIPIGYIEAKDVGDKDLQGNSRNKNQFDRYKSSLGNLLFTDYLDFYLYIDGEFIVSIKIAELRGGEIHPISENFASFEDLLKNFCVRVSQTIKSPKKLAGMMAGKARMLANVIGNAITSDTTSEEDSTLREQLEGFEKLLIHDITPEGFADIYAQTIVYGLFAARLHDPDLPSFSREEAARLIPKTNPFLRKLFGYIAGPDLDERIIWIVDDLVRIFLACDVKDILLSHGKRSGKEDPIVHFYETFLGEYDPELKDVRGVWYTPVPVVKFIVRAVDDVLKSHFDYPKGLADTSKTTIKVVRQQGRSRSKSGTVKRDEEVHRIQILDPATGTGTFLAETVRHIHRAFEGQEGVWNEYVKSELIPRLNGFELLMASYAVAHLKLDLLLTESGFKAEDNQRFRIYLTNSLEESIPKTEELFSSWLSSESNEASVIKSETPVMCVIGNPPYSGVSVNKGKWITKLIDDYKYVDGVHFGEKKHWLNDDYVKFIRLGEHFIERNGQGVLAYINNHSYADNPTFRGMRWHLLKTFDHIYTIDLHGNTRKKERNPDGSADENVFDIQQGVSINIFVKNGSKKRNDIAKVHHLDVWGKREEKYQLLESSNLNDLSFSEIVPVAPHYFFVPKDDTGSDDYSLGFKLDEMFPVHSLGMMTGRDEFLVGYTRTELEKRIEDASVPTESKVKDTNYFKWEWVNEYISTNSNELKSKIQETQYRPFDKRYVIYDGKLLQRDLYKVQQHLFQQNLGIIVCRQGQASNQSDWESVTITDSLSDINTFRRGGGTVFPAYLYTSPYEDAHLDSRDGRKPNLDSKLLNLFADKVGIVFDDQSKDGEDVFGVYDLVHYIYAVLHSPTYRKTYLEFLKTDFPLIPFPKDKAVFWELVSLGKELREVHLLASPKLEKLITQYPISGSNIIEKYKFIDGKVYINDIQYFDGVPRSVWEFSIGGNEPAYKWLKDRKGRQLSIDEITLYQQILVGLAETESIMARIEKIEIAKP